MNRVNNLALLLFTLLTLISCKKEMSLETDGTPVEPVFTNCKLQKLIEASPQTNTGEYAYISTYDAAHIVTRIEMVDSMANSVQNSFSVSYPATKIQLDADQYFVIDADSNVVEFHGHEFPTDPSSEMITAKYTYSGGQLVTRQEEYDSLPGVVTFQVDYTYSGNNLSKTEASMFDGAGFTKIGEINYEYDEAVTVKESLSLYALASELIYFQTAIRFGPRATNPIKKTTVQIVTPGTDNVNTYITDYVNYEIDTNNYIRSFEVTGDDFDLGGLYTGKKYILDYHCY